MAKSTTQGSLALSSYDDIFQVAPANTTKSEQVVIVPLSELHPPEFHPFQVRDDEAMQKTAESVAKNGVLVPGLVRPRAEGGYELVAGNRRKRACEINNMSTMPIIVRNMDDDEAVIAMVDTNLEQRESLLFSELAWAYRLKVEALNHRGAVVNGIDSGTLSSTIVANQSNTSKSQIFRYIRLTELVPDLMDLVDEKKIAFNPAVELSYLNRKEQALLLDCVAKHDATPSLSQAQQLRNFSKSCELTVQKIDSVLRQEKKPIGKITLQESRIKNYFPPSYTANQMEEIIITLLESWSKTQAAEN